MTNPSHLPDAPVSTEYLKNVIRSSVDDEAISIARELLTLREIIGAIDGRLGDGWAKRLADNVGPCSPTSGDEHG